MKRIILALLLFASTAFAQTQYLGGGGGSGGEGTGTVTSVTVTAPAQITVTGSPVTTSGTIALSWASAAQGTIFAGPCSGSGTPVFRAICNADIPTTLSGLASVSSTAFVGNLTGNVTGNVSGTSGSTTGNAATATQLAVNPSDCAANQFATTIAASGNLTCTGIADADVPNTITVDLATAATSLASNPSDCSASQFASAIDASGNLTCSQPVNVTGNAATATALAANPADCTGGQFANAIDASGNLTCGAASGGLPVADTTAIVTGSADATKILRFEIDGMPVGTNVATPPSAAAFTMARTDAAQTFTGVQTFSSAPTSPGSGALTERFGASATTSTFINSVAVGQASAIGGNYGVAVGRNATTTADAGVAIGTDAQVGGGNGVAIGYASSAGNTNAISIGRSITNGGVASIVMGYSASATASNQFIAGSPSAPISAVYIGRGVTDTSAASTTYNATGGSGTNNVGGSYVIAAGRSTGSARGGDVSVQTSPSGASGSSANALVDRNFTKAQAISLTSATASAVVDVALPTLTMAGGQIEWTIICTDGTDMQSQSGVVVYAAVNKGGTYTTSVTTPAGASPDDSVTPIWAEALSAGTLATAWSILNGTNKVTLRVTSTTSLTATKFALYYTVKNNSEQAITPN